MSDNVGFGLEDIARVVLPGYLERHLGIQVKEFSQKFFSVDGDEVKINLYPPGKKAGRRITVLGECKSRIYRREIRSFVRQAEKVRGFGEGEGCTPYRFLSEMNHLFTSIHLFLPKQGHLSRDLSRFPCSVS